jgi:hypothetical protein
MSDQAKREFVETARQVCDANPGIHTAITVRKQNVRAISLK